MCPEIIFNARNTQTWFFLLHVVLLLHCSGWVGFEQKGAATFGISSGGVTYTRFRVGVTWLALNGEFLLPLEKPK